MFKNKKPKEEDKQTVGVYTLKCEYECDPPKTVTQSFADWIADKRNDKFKVIEEEDVLIVIKLRE